MDGGITNLSAVGFWHHCRAAQLSHIEGIRAAQLDGKVRISMVKSVSFAVLVSGFEGNCSDRHTA